MGTAALRLLMKLPIVRALKSPRGGAENVDINALLGRRPVSLDTPELQRFLAGKRVLVTGAGGSIGSEICRQAMKFCPGQLILLDRAENSLFEIDRELRERWVGAELVPAIADVCDARRVRHVFEKHQPQVIFHAAAHKHVPMMEHNPGEAVKNNIFGTRTVADAALESAAAAFVLISTDKAVNPTSVMGASKRVAELYVQAMNGGGSDEGRSGSDEATKRRSDEGTRRRSDEGTRRRSDEGLEDASFPFVAPSLRRSVAAPTQRRSDEGCEDAPFPFVAPSLRRSVASAPTRFLAVRFGNVLGSSGSVVPIFRKQIEAGGPVTVTHPEMKRYFMTIPEASQLVMQAGAIGKGGEIFVLDMGEPVKILDLAIAMIRRSGLVPGEDIEIHYTGVRPGEKLYEELSGDDEQTCPTSHRKIRVWKLPAASRGQVNQMLDELRAVADAPRDQVISALSRCVPEYRADGRQTPTDALRLVDDRSDSPVSEAA